MNLKCLFFLFLSTPQIFRVFGVEEIKYENIFNGRVCEKSKVAHTIKESLDILENMKKLNNLKGRASVNKGPCDLFFFIIYAVLF